MVTEIPSNIALKHLKPSRFIPAVMLIWVRYLLGTRHRHPVTPLPVCKSDILTSFIYRVSS